MCDQSEDDKFSSIGLIHLFIHSHKQKLTPQVLLKASGKKFSDFFLTFMFDNRMNLHPM